MSLKANPKLTPEQERFWKILLVRATDSTYGQPYISYALFELTPISLPGQKTMSVDSKFRCYVDFEWAMEKGVEFAAKVLNHEPWHLLRRHHERFLELDAREDGKPHKHFDWNIAGDLTINGDIPTLVPDEGCHPERGEFVDYKRNRSTEEYYAQIVKDQRFNPPTCAECGQPNQSGAGDKKDDKSSAGKDGSDKSDSGAGSEDSGAGDSGDSQSGGDSGDSGQDGQQGQGDQSGEGADGGNSDGSGSDGAGAEGGSGAGDSGQDGQGSGQGQSGVNGSGAGNSGQGGSGSQGSTCGTCGQDKNGQGSGQGKPGAGTDCGSGAGGPAREWELGEGEAPSVDADRADQIRETVAQDIRKYAQSNPGSIPGHMKVWADEVLEGEPLDWRQLLRGQVKKAYSAWTKGKMDYVRSRPNRRQPSKDFIYPALQAPKPRMALAFDTSGSHLHKLGIVVEQTCDIVKQVGIRGRDLVAFPVDVVVGDVKKVHDPRKVLEDMTGGGGTDMRVGFEQLAKLNREEKFDIGIMFTDLQTGWPSSPPDGNMKYIVVGIVDSSSSWEMDWVGKAESAIGDWADVVIVDVNLVKD